MSDHGYSPSPSPIEDFEGDSDQEWEVAGIVGESIDAFNEKRYEVKWGEGWSRKDGTNTTWDRPNDNLAPFTETWDRKQAAKRLARAKESSAMAIGIEPWHMCHEDRTIERARGYEELKKIYLRNGMDPHQPVDFDAMRIKLRPSPSPAPGPSRARAPKSANKGTPASSSRSPPSSSSSIATEQRPIKPLPQRTHLRRDLLSPAPDSEEEERRRRGPHKHPHREHKRRKSLELNWMQHSGGAAPVTFVNELNYEEVPPLAEGFQYLERSYIRAPDVQSNANVYDCLVSCDCEDRCTDASECGCQGPSELEMNGEKIFAYTRKRLFNFWLPSGMEVIECNQACSCGELCPNRVAQRPRDVPIEIFRTGDRGWGARATVSIPRGKVLGVYTGRREEADTYEGERKSYIFDLDMREGEDDDDETEKYSVDGYAHGNWTRFVNHSCEPNLLVVPVIWDTIPELNQPYLAFVATKEIKPRTELTIDYDPKEAKAVAREVRKGKGKDRPRKPNGARDCFCGTDNCRGWVRV